MTKEEFAKERNLRTEQYTGARISKDWSVHVGIDDELAKIASGQLLVLSLTNQLARIYNRITFSVPAVPVVTPVAGFASQANLRSTLLHIAGKIHPFGLFSGDMQSPEPRVAVGIGNPDDTEYDFYVGMRRSIGLLARFPVISEPATQGALRGAAVASCLGAAAVFRSHLGLPVKDLVELSGWNFLEGVDAELGPEKVIPVDVGETLMVGAGAVASALCYWLLSIGVLGSWYIVDKDPVRLHNTNRSMLFLPSHAEADGRPAQSKAEILARLMPNAHGFVEWYDTCAELADRKFDVELCLANERDVRTRIARRRSVVVLHATTSHDWMAILHRHVAGVDDCIRCRTRDMRTPQFACSTSQMEDVATGEKRDASLPFLSAASGLMLATALEKLQLGELSGGNCNEWRWDFASTFKIASSGRRECLAECDIRSTPIEALRRINRDSRWKRLLE